MSSSARWRPVTTLELGDVSQDTGTGMWCFLVWGYQIVGMGANVRASTNILGSRRVRKEEAMRI